MIKNIILDFGMVLGRPATGNWFTTPSTKHIMGEMRYLKLILSPHRQKAYKDGLVFLNEDHLLHTEDEEIAQFTEFYKRVLHDVRIIDDGSLASKMAVDIVLNDSRVEFYDDVLPCLALLKSKYKVFILSDTWPSLSGLLARGGITENIDGLVKSCDYGMCKSNIELFREAISLWQIAPDESVFIDDNEINLVNSRKMGMVSLLMDRKGHNHQSVFSTVTSLYEIEAHAVQ